MKQGLRFLVVLGPLTVAAALARRWQVGSAFEADSGLLIPRSPATYTLVGLVLCAALALLALAQTAGRGREWRSYLAAFSLPGKGLMAVYVAAGACLVAAGALGLRAEALGLAAPVSRRLCALSLIPGGVCVGLTGWLGGQDQEAKGRFAWPLLGPGVCGCLWLIWAYQTNTAIPNRMAYVFYFFGIICASLASYDAAAFSFEKPKPRSFLWLAGMGTLLLAVCLTDFVDSGAYDQALVCLGYVLYLAGQLCCFLIRLDRPARLELWEPPADGEDVETEVTSHE